MFNAIKMKIILEKINNKNLFKKGSKVFILFFIILRSTFKKSNIFCLINLWTEDQCVLHALLVNYDFRPKYVNIFENEGATSKMCGF